MRLLSSSRRATPAAIATTVTAVAVAAVFSSALLGGADAQSLRVFGLNYNARSGPDWEPHATRCKSPEAVKQDIDLLKTVTGTVRLYSLTDCDQGELVIPVALAAGLKVSVGLWVSDDPEVFRREKEKLRELIAPERGLFDASRIFDIHVGSEAIYRGDVKPEDNIKYMREVKELCRKHNSSAGIPVTIAEIGDTYLGHEELVREVDVVSANGFPFWEKWPVETAAQHFHDRMTPLFDLAARHGKRVFISETGWASAGSSEKASVASPKNAQTYFRDFTAMASKFKWEYFYFAAFDEAWKVSGAKEDTVEAHFGLFHADRTLKDEYKSAGVGSPGAAGAGTGAGTGTGTGTGTAATAPGGAGGGQMESASAGTGATSSSAPPTPAPGPTTSSVSGTTTAPNPTPAPTTTLTPSVAPSTAPPTPPTAAGGVSSTSTGGQTQLSGSTGAGATGGKDKCAS